jgi:hypothetical protein
MVSKFGRRQVRCLAAALAATGVLALTPPAAAGPCGSREQIIRELGTIFKEQRTALGLMLTGNLLEVYVATGGSWTIVVSTPNGLACIVASGENWEQDSVQKGTGV